MTVKQAAFALITLGLLLIWQFVGCSGDNSASSNSEPLSVEVPAFDELISVVAPPTFSETPTLVSPVQGLAADTGYGFWALGNQAVLGRMFGSGRQTALHRNMRRVRSTVQLMNLVRRLGDTTFTGAQTADGEFSGTMSATRLQAAVSMPEECHSVLGDTALRLQYHIRIRLNEQTQTQLEAGIRHDDTCDIMLAYQGFASPDSLCPNAYEHCLTYAYRNSVSDSVQVRAVHFRAYNDPSGHCAMWAYQINSQNGGDFFYRLSWYADDFADTCGLVRMLGSGNRATQFALRYQQIVPADRPEPNPDDPYGHVQHTFGAGYADQGATLSSGLNDATDPSKMFRLEHLPVGLRSSPALAEGTLNPWFQD
jgi:hypothetical protein